MATAIPLTSAQPAASPGDIRVMVVDDSAVARGLVSRWLDEVPGISVVSRQANGRAAIADLESSWPDVVVLDIEMPEMDGLTALPLILRRRPGVAVVIASTLTRRNGEIALKALSLGARDCIAKPGAGQGLAGAPDYRQEIVGKVKALGQAVRSRAGGERRTMAAAAEPKAEIRLREASPTRPRVLVIGSSTGGPPALVALAKALGAARIRIPILIAQHMPPTFTSILAEHVGLAAGMPAAEARDGETIMPGRIYVAPGGHHMRVANPESPIIRLDQGPPIKSCRPAVDPFFESAAQVFGEATLALVLTGMGHDGTIGARAVADAGGTVIAQDEATSVVWGMPGSAARDGICADVLPLDAIAPRVISLIRGEGL